VLNPIARHFAVNTSLRTEQRVNEGLHHD